MKTLLHALSIDRFVVFYDELDLDLLNVKVGEAIAKFDEDGAEGMEKRINFIINHHHVDVRINFLINFRHGLIKVPTGMFFMSLSEAKI